MPAAPRLLARVLAAAMAAWLLSPPLAAAAAGSSTGGAGAKGFAFPSAASSATKASTSSSATTDPNAPVPIADTDVVPPGRRLSPHRVLAIAAALPKVRAERARYPGSYGGAYLKGPGRWQVSYFSRNGRKEIVQVLISDSNGRVLEQWTGFQVAWTMARGYPGAFGHRVNALYIWIPLSILFVLPFINWRRPLSLLHLDLLALSAFSISLAFLNHGRIYASVPLVYPPLVYLLGRMLLVAWPRRRRTDATTGPLATTPSATGLPAPTSSATAPSATASPGTIHPPARTRPPTLPVWVPAHWLAVGVVFLLGFRVALNVVDGNVIDVGYAGVIGASRIVHGQPLYGQWPSDNQHGDTYGPFNYEAYVPFERVIGWSGTRDQLPAAHGAAIAFDVLAVGLMFLLGRRIRGPTLGVVLAYAWVSYPFTLYALECDSNDTLVAVLVLAAILAAGRPMARGALAALAGLTKFAPLALAPLLATHGLQAAPPRQRALTIARFSAAFVLTAAVVCIPAFTHSSLHTFYERTLAYQANRGSPFSVWGLYGGLGGLQAAVQAAAVLGAIALAVLPRRPDVIGLAASAAAILIAVQLGIDHWFYLYIPWFFGLVMLALLGRFSEPAQIEAEASEPARSRQLVAA